MRSPLAEIAAPVEDIDTPALIVDLDPFERNLEKMARVARNAGVRLRPHAKTHKCPEIAKRQIALGDPTVNLHDWYVGVRAGYVEALWPITARGASR